MVRRGAAGRERDDRLQGTANLDRPREDELVARGCQWQRDLRLRLGGRVHGEKSRCRRTCGDSTFRGYRLDCHLGLRWMASRALLIRWELIAARGREKSGVSLRFRAAEPCLEVSCADAVNDCC